MPISEYLRTTTRRQHLVWLAWLHEQMNVPSRSDWHVIKGTWSHLSAEGRPSIGEWAQLFRDDGAPRAEEPFPRYTKETAAMARAALQKGQLKRNLKVK